MFNIHLEIRKAFQNSEYNPPFCLLLFLHSGRNSVTLELRGKQLGTTMSVDYSVTNYKMWLLVKPIDQYNTFATLILLDFEDLQHNLKRFFLISSFS